MAVQGYSLKIILLIEPSVVSDFVFTFCFVLFSSVFFLLYSSGIWNYCPKSFWSTCRAFHLKRKVRKNLSKFPRIVASFVKWCKVPLLEYNLRVNERVYWLFSVDVPRRRYLVNGWCELCANDTSDDTHTHYDQFTRPTTQHKQLCVSLSAVSMRSIAHSLARARAHSRTPNRVLFYLCNANCVSFHWRWLVVAANRIIWNDNNNSKWERDNFRFGYFVQIHTATGWNIGTKEFYLPYTFVSSTCNKFTDGDYCTIVSVKPLILLVMCALDVLFSFRLTR